jgi:hypothetical protein
MEDNLAIRGNVISNQCRQPDAKIDIGSILKVPSCPLGDLLA